MEKAYVVWDAIFILVRQACTLRSSSLQASSLQGPTGFDSWVYGSIDAWVICGVKKEMSIRDKSISAVFAGLHFSSPSRCWLVWAQ